MTISDIITFDLLSRYDGKIKNWIRALKATTTQDGLMSKEDKATLDGLVAGGGEPNQNAFSNIKVGNTTIEADAKTDTLEIVAGANMSITPDASGDKVTIAGNYLDATTSASGLMSSGDKSKLNGVASGAQANVIEAVSVGGVAASISGKTASITNVYTKTETDSAIATALTSAVVYKGSVATYADLPSSGMQNGWLYNVTETDMNYVWNSTSNAWDPQAPTVTIAAATNAQIDSLFA